MGDLVRQVEQAIREQRLLRRGDSVLVAVSGGVDSMVLLHVLARLARPHRWRLAVAHFNHRLRGRSSDADERLVRRVTAALGLPLTVERADVKAFARAQRLSVEMAARELRHAFLARTARRRRCAVIALAHHADDQVELFFVRLLRGAGPEGLAGMKWRSASPADARLSIVRPLLGMAKAGLRKFARAERIPFREDASNRSPDMLRNRVRRELLPLLEARYQSAARDIVLRVMDLLRAEADAVKEQAEAWLRRRTRVPFSRLPLAVQRRVVQRQLFDLGVKADFDLVERLRERPGQLQPVAADWSVYRDAAGHVRRVAVEPLAFQPGRKSARLTGGRGAVTFDGVRVAWTVLRRRPGPLRGLARVEGVELFDADKVGEVVMLRHWQAADRFQPIGMRGRVKLQDWLGNRKIPAVRRRELVLATTAAGELFWIEGQRIAEGCKLTPGTRRVLRWRWERLPEPRGGRRKWPLKVSAKPLADGA